MAKQWTMIAHPNYFRSLRSAITDSELRYRFVTEIWDQLQENDNLQDDARIMPDAPNCYEIDLMGYTLIFKLPDDKPNDLELLEVYKQVDET